MADPLVQLLVLRHLLLTAISISRDSPVNSTTDPRAQPVRNWNRQWNLIKFYLH